MGGEIVTIHLGQAGLQVSHALWELVCVEHGIMANGSPTLEAIEQMDYEVGREYVFREVNRSKFVPRALLIDLEPTVMDEIRTGAYRSLWHPMQLINGKEDAASNFARGYYSQNRLELDEVLDRIRILVEQCDNMSCFKLLYSVNGGTGSGLTSVLCERLSEEYGKKHKFATSIYPSPGYSELMVEPYNALLHSSTNLTFCDCVIITDNEAMLNVVEDSLRLQHPGFTVPNRVIANAITTQFLSHRYRFVGQQHCHVDELLINLIPYPRIHFPMVAFAPFMGAANHDFEKCNAVDLVRSVFEDSNQLLSVSAVRRAYISCALLFRGPTTPLEAISAVSAIKADRMSKARFVDWCPTGFKVGVNFAPPVQPDVHNTISLKNNSLSMIAGNLSIRDVWTGIARRFDQLYEKRAYVHWYIAEGMEESEFSLAREIILQLVEDYESIAKDAEGAMFDRPISTSENQLSKSAPSTRKSAGIKPNQNNQGGIGANQVTTLDDPNSLPTMENNEDNMSLDTNQHHSGSTLARNRYGMRARGTTEGARRQRERSEREGNFRRIEPYQRRQQFDGRNASNSRLLAQIPSPKIYGTNCSAATNSCPSPKITPNQTTELPRLMAVRKMQQNLYDRPTCNHLTTAKSNIPKFQNHVYLKNIQHKMRQSQANCIRNSEQTFEQKFESQIHSPNISASASSSSIIVGTNSKAEPEIESEQMIVSLISESDSTDSTIRTTSPSLDQSAEYLMPTFPHSIGQMRSQTQLSLGHNERNSLEIATEIKETTENTDKDRSEIARQTDSTNFETSSPNITPLPSPFPTTSPTFVTTHSHDVSEKKQSPTVFSHQHHHRHHRRRHHHHHHHHNHDRYHGNISVRNPSTNGSDFAMKQTSSNMNSIDAAQEKSTDKIYLYRTESSTLISSSQVAMAEPQIRLNQHSLHHQPTPAPRNLSGEQGHEKLINKVAESTHCSVNEDFEQCSDIEQSSGRYRSTAMITLSSRSMREL